MKVLLFRQLAYQPPIGWQKREWRPFQHRAVFQIIGGLVKWTANTAILDFTTHRQWPAHMSAEAFRGNVIAFNQPYHQDLCPNRDHFGFLGFQFFVFNRIFPSHLFDDLISR